MSSRQKQYEDVLETRNKGIVELVSDARENGVWEAAHDFAEDKTDGFRFWIIAFYAFKYLSHPVLWCAFLLNQAVRADATTFSLSWFAFLICFGVMLLLHRKAEELIRIHRDVIPLAEPDVEFVEFGLAEGKSVDSEYTDAFEEATEALAENLREEGAEVWQVDGNKVVSERGCFVGYESGQSPEGKQVAFFY